MHSSCTVYQVNNKWASVYMCIPKTNVKNLKCLYKKNPPPPKKTKPQKIIDVKINRKINSNFSVSFKLFPSLPLDPFANNCRHN